MRLLMFSVVVSLFAVMSSCQKDFTFDSKHTVMGQQKPSVTMSIDEGKYIFQKEINRSDTSTQDMSLRSPLGRMKILPKWELAKKYDYGTVSEMDIPVGFANDTKVDVTDRDTNAIKSGGVKTIIRLILSKNSKGETSAKYLVVSPDEDYSPQMKLEEFSWLQTYKEFSGTAMLYDLKGAYMTGLKYRDGKSLGRINFAPIDFNRNPAISRDLICIYWVTTVSNNGFMVTYTELHACFYLDLDHGSGTYIWSWPR